MKKNFMSLAVAALLGLSGVAASAAPVYTVNEGAIAGTPNSTFEADSFGSKYEERIQITGANTFSSTAFFNNFVFANTNVGPGGVSSYLGIQESLFGGVGYRLYGTFTSTGTYVTDGAGVTTFTGTGGYFSIWADAKQDTTLGYTAGSIAINVGGGQSDDVLLASSSNLVLASGQMKSGEQAGGYALIFEDLLLTATGKQYFVDPDPFYAVARATGQFDTFQLPGIDGIVSVKGGSLDGTFRNIPEPGSVALLGLGLAGLAFSQRRRNQAK